jgi:hypothetical protein
LLWFGDKLNKEKTINARKGNRREIKPWEQVSLLFSAQEEEVKEMKSYCSICLRRKDCGTKRESRERIK